MKRVSATTLETFRRYLSSVSDNDTEDKVIQSIKGLFAGNDMTKVGNGFHALLEGKFVKQGQRYYAEGILFNKDQAQVAFEFRARHPYMVHEMQLSAVFETYHGPIMISGRVDGIEGLEIHDHKLKFRNPDYLEYMDSIQWKIYLSALGVDVFHYNIFEVQGFEALLGLAPHILQEEVNLIPHEPLTLTRFDGMEEEIVSLLNDFQEFVDDRELSQFLKPEKDFSHF